MGPPAGSGRVITPRRASRLATRVRRVTTFPVHTTRPAAPVYAPITPTHSEGGRALTATQPTASRPHATTRSTVCVSLATGPGLVLCVPAPPGVFESEPYITGKKTPGGAGTHTGHTGAPRSTVRLYRYLRGFGRRVVVRVCRWVWMVVRFVCVFRVPVCARVSRACPVCVPAQVKSIHKQQTTIRKPIECAPEASSGGRELT